jgi:hypothetical protein
MREDCRGRLPVIKVLFVARPRRGRAGWGGALSPLQQRAGGWGARRRRPGQAQAGTAKCKNEKEGYRRYNATVYWCSRHNMPRINQTSQTIRENHTERLSEAPAARAGGAGGGDASRGCAIKGSRQFCRSGPVTGPVPAARVHTAQADRGCGRSRAPGLRAASRAAAWGHGFGLCTQGTHSRFGLRTPGQRPSQAQERRSRHGARDGQRGSAPRPRADGPAPVLGRRRRAAARRSGGRGRLGSFGGHRRPAVIP